MGRLTNTKALFIGLLKAYHVDLVLDIGSCDGSQARAFRVALPEADIAAIEANPHNFKDILQDPLVIRSRIVPHHVAMTNEDGRVDFLVSTADYNSRFSATNNRGTSSILKHPDLEIQETVSVPAFRLDTFVSKYHPSASSTGLWIDVEAAEYLVLEGMSGIREHVSVLHVETAHRPMRHGQKCYAEVADLMAGYGFQLMGSNIRDGQQWGDVVYARAPDSRSVSRRVKMARAKARISCLAEVGGIAAFLKSRFPSVHRLGRKIFIKSM